MHVVMLPAEHGDSLVIEYDGDGKTHTVLIDAGTSSVSSTLCDFLKRTYPKPPRRLALMVVTHIDDDHIGGILPLLSKHADLISPAEIWFNGYRHLPADNLGATQGIQLEEHIDSLGYRWNSTFANSIRSAVMLRANGTLPTVKLAGGAVLTLLSPNESKLTKLRAQWDKTVGHGKILTAMDEQFDGDTDVLGKRRIRPTISGNTDLEKVAAQALVEDTAPANGSSIAFLLERAGKRVLLGADAHPAVLTASLRRVQPTGRLVLEAFKVSHHGSAKNTSQALLESISCKKYLVSTNGSKFEHPDPEAIARLIVYHDTRVGPAEIHFNYKTKFNDMWDDPQLKSRYGYETYYGNGSEGQETLVEI